MSVAITRYRRMEKQGLLGFFDCRLYNNTIEIRDVAHRVTDGREWVAMPSRRYEAADGTTKFASYVSFPEKRHYEAFQESCLRAIEEFRKRPPADQGQKRADDSIPF